MLFRSCVGGRSFGRRRLASRLVVIGDFDFVGMAFLPFETDPVLLVDPDAVLPFPFTTASIIRQEGSDGPDGLGDGIAAFWHWPSIQRPCAKQQSRSELAERCRNSSVSWATISGTEDNWSRRSLALPKANCPSTACCGIPVLQRWSHRW